MDRRRGRDRVQLLSLSPREYDAWYLTPLGAAIDAAEARAVLGLAAPKPGERGLDAGCGTGIYTQRLADLGLEVTGVDADPEMLAAARSKVPGATFVEGDVLALPFDEGEFDLTIAVTLLCFVGDPQAAVNEMVRVTRTGGRVVLGELNRLSTWALRRRLKALAGSKAWRGTSFFGPARLTRLLEGAGATKVRTTTAAYLPPAAPGWLVERSAAVERLGSRFGPLGAAFVAARGNVP